MPSSPKIKKEDMLQAALELVSKNGYAALNIKAVAGELGCSTAPISWQFGGMDGLREELIPLALENPNLFRFLYMGERSQLLSTGFELQTNNQDAANVYQEMAELLGITPKQVMDFAMTMMVYTQGIGTLIASGIVKDTKENMYRMLHNTGMTYLKGLGVKGSTLWDLSGGDRSDESSSNG